jgi:type IV pilus assembly protein PilX
MVLACLFEGRQPGPPAWRQRGAALMVTLCVMLAMMIVGVSAMRSALNGEKAARGERDRGVAFQAAEAALVDAERDIDGAAGPHSARAAMFRPGRAADFVDGCGAGAGNPALGLCARAIAPATPVWQRVRLDAQEAARGARFVEYGRFTGATMPVGKHMLPARLPRYIIEQLPYVRAGESAGGPTELFYRITAIGFGASVRNCVVLQSYYLKPVADRVEA